jgi:hypothetical protein
MSFESSITNNPFVGIEVVEGFISSLWSSTQTEDTCGTEAWPLWVSQILLLVTHSNCNSLQRLASKSVFCPLCFLVNLYESYEGEATIISEPSPTTGLYNYTLNGLPISARYLTYHGTVWLKQWVVDKILCMFRQIYFPPHHNIYRPAAI